MPVTKINLVVSLIPVGTRQANVGDQFFALHLSAAFDVDVPEQKDLLLPWKSDWRVSEIRTITSLGQEFTSEPTGDKKKPSAVAENLKVLRDKLVEGKDRVWSPASITTNPKAPEKNAPNQQASLIEAVHALSLYPGSVPNDSGVLYYFQIDPDGWIPANEERIAAVPTLELSFNGRNVIFTPKVNFSFDDWQDGWEYLPTEDGQEIADITLTAYVKPLKIADATGIFYDEEEETTDGFGLNFKDYWFRSRRNLLWQERLEEYAEAVVSFEKRMAESAAAFVNSGVETYDALEDLRLMSLGIYAQWGNATIDDLPVHIKTAIFDRLKNDLNFTDPELIDLDTAFDSFRVGLKKNPLPELALYERARVRRLWLNVFRHAFGEAPEAEIPQPDPSDLPGEEEIKKVYALLTSEDKSFAGTILKRSSETPADFIPTLFYIWDYAVDKLTADELKKKWNDAFRNARKASSQGIIGEIFGASGIREKFKKENLISLIAKTSSREVADFIKARLLLLRNYFESAAFAPSVLGNSDPLWNALWSDWETKYVDEYIQKVLDNDAQITDSEPKFETKPGGLTIQFDKLAGRENITPKDEEARWRKIAGVGVLVREKDAANPKKWHLATAAAVQTNFSNISAPRDLREFVNQTTLKIVVDTDSVAGMKYDLRIGGKVFKSVFETQAASSGTIGADKIKITPSFVASQSNGVELKIESVAADLRFTIEDLSRIEFIPALLTETALIPARVPYKNGIRYPFLTYNQRSIISPVALANAVKYSFVAKDERTDPNATRWAPLYMYGAPDITENFYKLVPLKFGKKYQMSAFMIDTAGGLPEELKSGEPFTFEPNENIAPPADPEIITEFDYWRKVPVGQVRISALDLTGADTPVNWQEVPEKVFPLAWEVEPDEQAKTTHPSEQKNRRKQLILLHDRTPKYVFGVRPPTVDIDVLERWLPFSSATDAKHLTGILISYFKRLRKQNPNNPPGDRNDLTIDDPAVEKFLFVLENYNFEEEKWKVVSAHPHELPPIAGDDLEAYQRRWQKVVCLRAGENVVRQANPANTGENGFDVAVTVKHDTVNLVRLRVLALVPTKFVENPAHVSQKFSAGFFEEKSSANDEQFSPDKPDEFLFLENFDLYDYESDAVKTAVENLKSNFIALKSQQILLETPNNKMPDEQKLWRSLTPVLEGNKDVVSVLLKEFDSQNADEQLIEKTNRRNVIRCELRRQQWRWQGRPIERETNTDIKLLRTEWTRDGIVVYPPDDRYIGRFGEFLKWEVTAFADMSEAFDLITVPIPYSIHAPELLYRDDFTNDIPARYIRYGLRVFSRYEGLFPVEPVTTKQPFNPEAGVHQDKIQLSGTGWKRALIGYRGAKPAKPLVQAIVPLTQSFTPAEKAASLMLVLDQTAHAQCGITEQLECELTKIKLPFSDKFLYEGGHDAILRIDPSGLPVPKNEEERLIFRLSGAFGHTFDTGARQPLFASSSYIIQGNAEDKYIFEDWDFAKIRLRRLSGNEDGAAPGNNDWTDPLWVQFPPSSKFTTETVLAVTLKPDGKTFNVNFPADPEKFPMYKYCLVLTREITDFRGQQKSEAYFGWVSLKNAAEATNQMQGVFEETITERKKLKARLAEIQVAPSEDINDFKDLPEAGADFWDNLLKVEAEGDSLNARYRITRISDVIEVKEEN